MLSRTTPPMRISTKVADTLPVAEKRIIWQKAGLAASGNILNELFLAAVITTITTTFTNTTSSETATSTCITPTYTVTSTPTIKHELTAEVEGIPRGGGDTFSRKEFCLDST